MVCNKPFSSPLLSVYFTNRINESLVYNMKINPHTTCAMYLNVSILNTYISIWIVDVNDVNDVND